jgi:regulator of RNase E activity RraA
MKQIPSLKVFRDLTAFDSCSIANAVDSLGVRLLNEGFGGSEITCRTQDLPPMAGVAITLKVRSSEPPMKPAFYLALPDWWERLDEAPFPRVLVIEDVDARPGRGALVGAAHACIIKAMGFAGVITTGAVRATRRFADIRLHAFSGNVSPSHAYCHVVEMGGKVVVAGATIETGDVIHGDRDGFVSIPAELAEKTADAARFSAERERVICEFCGTHEFSRAKIRALLGLDPRRR